ncbi:MAG TPA: TIGR04282 family arsenosugar biosynthesis glycosyltransferase [Allosphingosinicella sp.]
MKRTRIIIFAKAPVPGKVKTRLIPALGEIGAARLANEMLQATVREAVAANLLAPELCADPHPLDEAWNGFLPEQHLRVTAQGEGGLGERLARVTKRTILLGENALLIGTDCPKMDAARLRAAAAALEASDAFIHPTEDGGYALLGLRWFDEAVFADIPWSTDRVAAETMARIEGLGWSLQVGETLRDVDEPEDLQA